MLSAIPRGQRHCPTAVTHRVSFGAVLLTALACICSQSAFAQMERLNAKMHRQQTGHSGQSSRSSSSSSSSDSSSDAPPNPDCTLIVPSNPLSAKGLSTPFQLVATDPNGGPC